MAGSNEAEPLDLTKMSVSDLVHKTKVSQLIVVVSTLIGTGYAAGQFFAGLTEHTKIEKLEVRVEQLTDENTKIELAKLNLAEQSTKLTKQLKKMQVAMLSCQATTHDQEITKCISQLENERIQCVADATLDHKVLTEKLERAEASVKECSTRRALPLNNYFVNTNPGIYNISECLSQSMEAASQLGASVKRNGSEIQMNLTVDSGSYYCSSACFDNIITFSCNGPSNTVSRGMTDRLRQIVILRQ